MSHLENFTTVLSFSGPVYLFQITINVRCDIYFSTCITICLHRCETLENTRENWVNTSFVYHLLERIIKIISFEFDDIFIYL